MLLLLLLLLLLEVFGCSPRVEQLPQSAGGAGRGKARLGSSLEFCSMFLGVDTYCGTHTRTQFLCRTASQRRKTFILYGSAALFQHWRLCNRNSVAWLPFLPSSLPAGSSHVLKRRLQGVAGIFRAFVLKLFGALNPFCESEARAAFDVGENSQILPAHTQSEQKNAAADAAAQPAGAAGRGRHALRGRREVQWGMRGMGAVQIVLCARARKLCR